MISVATALPRRLKQLDRIAVRIFDLDLAAAGTGLHLVAKTDAFALECGNTTGEIRNSEHHTIPSAGLLALTIWQWTRS